MRHALMRHGLLSFVEENSGRKSRWYFLTDGSTTDMSTPPDFFREGEGGVFLYKFMREFVCVVVYTYLCKISKLGKGAEERERGFNRPNHLTGYTTDAYTMQLADCRVLL